MKQLTIKKHNRFKLKCIGLILSICMLLTAIPTDVLAEDGSDLHMVKIDAEHFPQMYKTLKHNVYDKNEDGWLSKNEIESMRYVYVDTEISDIKGLEYLTSVEKLIIQNYTGKTLTISEQNEKLVDLYVNPFASSLTVNAKYLKRLFVTSVDGKYYDRGEDCYANPSVGYGTATPTKTLSVKGCTSLESLYVTSKNITNYTFSSSIEKLEIRYNSVKKLSLNSMKNLKHLKIDTCDKLSDMNCSNNKNLKYVSMDNCPKLKSVNFSGLKGLTHIYLTDNVAVSKIDLSKCKKIKMAVVNTWGHDIDVVMPKGMKSKLTKYDPNKREAYYNVQSKVGEIISKNGIDHYDNNSIETDYHWNKEGDENTGSSFDYYQKKLVKWDRTEFPELYSKITGVTIDWDGDGWLTQSELDSLYYISIDDKISNLKGLEYFRRVNKLELKNYTGKTLAFKEKSSRINTIYVHTNQKEFKLNAPYVENIQVVVDKNTKTVDLSKCTNAVAISVEYSGYNERALSKLILPKTSKKLRYLELNNLNISSPSFKNYPNIEALCIVYCPKISTLDLTKNKELRGFWYTKMDKTKRNYDFSKCTKLEEFYNHGDKGSMNIKKPKGVSLPTRETNAWMYEVFHSLDCYRK